MKTPTSTSTIKKISETPDMNFNYYGFTPNRTVIIKSREEWEQLANDLKGYKHSGSLSSVTPNRDLTQMHNYAKFPYEVVINDKEKLIAFGDHSLKEIQPAKPIVKQEPNKRLTVPVSPAERKTPPPKVRQQNNPIREAKSSLTKQDIIRIIKEEINIALDEMYDPIYDSLMPEILTMLAAGGLGVKAAISHLKSKGLDKQVIIDLIKKAQAKLSKNK